MGTTVTIVEGDTAGDIEITLSAADGPKGLSGATVHAYLKDLATNVAVNAACTIVDEAAIVGHADRGKVNIPAASRAAWVAGDYALEVKVTYSGGAIDWWPTDHFAGIEIRARRTA